LWNELSLLHGLCRLWRNLHGKKADLLRVYESITEGQLLVELLCLYWCVFSLDVHACTPSTASVSPASSLASLAALPSGAATTRGAAATIKSAIVTVIATATELVGARLALGDCRCGHRPDWRDYLSIRLLAPRMQKASPSRRPADASDQHSLGLPRVSEMAVTQRPEQGRDCLPTHGSGSGDATRTRLWRVRGRGVTCVRRASALV